MKNTYIVEMTKKDIYRVAIIADCESDAKKSARHIFENPSEDYSYEIEFPAAEFKVLKVL